MTIALDIPGLVHELDQFDRHLFRLETLPFYAVTDDGDDYLRYTRGHAEPDWSRKTPWLDRLRADRDAGRTRTRVRVLSAALTDYERYACSWGYALNVEAGEDIRVLRHGEHRIPDGLIERDFWIVDDHEVVAMDYSSAGFFQGARVLPQAQLAEHLDARGAAWTAAEPFTSWWTRHPELHRNAAPAGG